MGDERDEQQMTLEERAVLDEEALDHLVTKKVNGVEKQLTVRELLAEAQKAEAADQKFREASELRRAAENDMELARDLREGLAERDTAKLTRAFRNSGLSDDEIAAVFAGPQQSQTQRSESYDDGGEEDEGGDQHVTALQNQVAALQQQVESLTGAYEKATENSTKRREFQEVNSYLDSDPELSRILKGMDDETAQWWRSQAWSAVKTASNTLRWGPRSMQSGLDTIRKRLIGSRARGSGNPLDEDQDVLDDPTYGGTPGLPPSGNSAGRLYQTAGEPKRVPVTDPNYNRNVFDRIASRLKKGKR